MNEYEAAEILNGVVANTLSAQAMFFTALSAYLAVAYSVGKQLSRYQVLFVNVLFILIFVNQSANQYGLFQAAVHYVDVVETARSSAIDPIPNISRNVNALMFLSIRSLLLLGALLFMWSVRHPKSE
jgi:hypothetical protein